MINSLWRIVLVSVFLLPALAWANLPSCDAVFGGGVSSGSASGSLTINGSAKILNHDDPGAIDFASANGTLPSGSCGSSTCQVSGNAGQGISLPTYIASSSSSFNSLSGSTSVVIGSGSYTATQYGQFTLNSNSSMTFAAAGGSYSFKDFSLNSDAVVSFPPGDYYFNKLSLSSSTKILFDSSQGAGSARLHVKNGFSMNSSSTINDGANPSNIVLFVHDGSAYNDFAMNSSTKLNAIIYAEGRVTLNSSAAVTGSLSAGTLTMNGSTSITHSGSPNDAAVADVCDTTPDNGGGGQCPLTLSADEQNFADCFSLAAYSNNDGSLNWRDNWQESIDGSGAAGGDIVITNNQLRLARKNRAISRNADLSPYSSAVVSFDYQEEGFDDNQDRVLFQVSNDSSNWNTVQTLQGANLGAGSVSVDISNYISSDTYVRFFNNNHNNFGSTDYLYIDRFHITVSGAYSNSCNTGGNTFLDCFDSTNLENNNGVATESFAAGWVEGNDDGNAASGQISIVNNRLRLSGKNNYITREVDLSKYSSATLSFSYSQNGFDNDQDKVTVSISSDQGTSWTNLTELKGSGLSDGAISNLDITEYIGRYTQVRFSTNNDNAHTQYDELFIDNFAIDASGIKDDSCDTTAASGVATFIDCFSSNPASYSGSQGNTSFASDWIEGNDGSSGVTGGWIDIHQQRLSLSLKNRNIRRQMDLSAYTSATLSFDYVEQGFDSDDDKVTVQIRTDGATWIPLPSLELKGQNLGAGSITDFDISDHVSSQTEIQFLTNNNDNFTRYDTLYIDNFRVNAAGAWDGSANCVSETNTFLDCFDSVAYNNSNGDLSWANDWDEGSDNDNASSGSILIVDGRLKLSRRNRNIQRWLDISAYSNATLSFDYSEQGFDDNNDTVNLEISSDGSNWTSLQQFTGSSVNSGRVDNLDISQHISPTTRIRFKAGESGSLTASDSFYIDNFLVRVSGKWSGVSSCEQNATGLLDCFSNASYGNNDGDVNWLSDWQETNDDNLASSGNVLIYQGRLRLSRKDSSAQRSADLNLYTSAILTFDFEAQGFDSDEDNVRLQIRAGNSDSWTTLKQFNPSAYSNQGNFKGAFRDGTAIDISDYISSETQLRFRSDNESNFSSSDFFFVDNVKIEVSGKWTGGADCVTASDNLLDCFNSVAYSNSDGDKNWDTSWVEINDDGLPATGEIQIVDNRLRLARKNRQIYREADLNEFGSAVLTFDYQELGFDTSDDVVYLEISDNKGQSWTELTSFAGPDVNEGEIRGNTAIDISQYISAYTRIRFRNKNNGNFSVNDEFYIDNFRIDVTDKNDQVSGCDTDANTFLDCFDAAAYNNQDGNENWLSDWDERQDDDIATSGDVLIYEKRLRIANRRSIIERDVDLSRYATAKLSFEYEAQGFDTNVNSPDNSDKVSLKVSTDAGNSWQVLHDFIGASVGKGEFSDTTAIDISDYISSQTRLRFEANNNGSFTPHDHFYVDNFRIDITEPVFDGVNCVGSTATFLDCFNTDVYSGQNGTDNWLSNWTEAGDDNSATSGQVKIIDKRLRLARKNRSITRIADLSGYTQAELSFDYFETGYDDDNDKVELLISTNGSDWVSLAEYKGSQVDSGQASFDITEYLSATTHIRFATGSNNNLSTSDHFYIDNVAITASNNLAKYQIVHEKSSPSCTEQKVYVNACKNADCSQLFEESVTLTLQKTVNSLTSDLFSETFSSGKSQELSFSNQVPATLTYGLTGLNPSASFECVDLSGIATDCTTEFTADFTLSFSSVPDIQSCNSQSLTLNAIAYDPDNNMCNAYSGSADLTISFSYSQPATNAASTNLAASSGGTTVDLAAGVAQSLSVVLNQADNLSLLYPDAGTLALTIEDAGSSIGSYQLNENVTVVPSQLSISAFSSTLPNAALTSVAAGTPYSIRVGALCADGITATPNYVPRDLSATVQRNSQGSANGLFDYDTTDEIAASAITTAGVVVDLPEQNLFSNVMYSEYGQLTISLQDTFTGTSSVSLAATNLPKSIAHNINIVPSNGEFAHKGTSNPFIYIGESFAYESAPTLLITAQNSSGENLLNWPGASTDHFDLTELCGNGSNFFCNSTENTASMVVNQTNNSYLYSFNSSDNFWLIKNTAGLAGPLTIDDADAIKWTLPIDKYADDDGVGNAASITVTPELKTFRYGQLKVAGGRYGLGELVQPVLQMQYYDGTRFVLNTDDSQTKLLTSYFATNPAASGSSVPFTVTSNGMAAEFNWSVNDEAVSGEFSLQIQHTNDTAGSLQINFDDLPMWMQGPWGDDGYTSPGAINIEFVDANYRGNNRIISSRENN